MIGTTLSHFKVIEKLGQTLGGNRMLSRRGFLTGSAVCLSVLQWLRTTRSYAETGDPTGGKGPRKFIDVDGIRTSYFEGGAGEDMVLVHGGHFGSPMSSAIAWTAIFPLLAAHFHVRAVDKLGMGFTDNPRGDADYSMEAVVEHIYRFMQIKGIQKVHLMGQSRGGLPVARIAVDHPELVKTLTIFDSNTVAPGDPPPVTSDIPAFYVAGGPALNKDLIRERLFSGLHNRENIAAEILEEMVEQHLAVAVLPKTRQAAERFDLLRSRYVEQNRDKVLARPALARNSGTGWWMYQVKDETLDLIRAGRLKSPTQIIWGGNDQGAGYELGIDLFELISQSLDRTQFHLFNHCGHHPFAEYPQEVTELLLSFIKSSSA